MSMTLKAGEIYKVGKNSYNIPEGTIIEIAYNSTLYSGSHGYVYYVSLLQPLQQTLYCTESRLKLEEASKVEKEMFKKEQLKMVREDVQKLNIGALGGETGADPEIFVVSNKTKRIIPSWKFLPDKTQAKGKRVCEAFWDGFQAEWTTVPSACHAYAVDSIQHGMGKVLKAARAKYPEAFLTHECLRNAGKLTLKNAEMKYLEFGCAPSLNVYGDKGVWNEDFRKQVERSAGFHVHFSWSKDYLKAPVEEIVKTIDAVSGVTSVVLLQGLEDPRRRFMYGLAGEYRLPSYGIEYRTLSSAVMVHPAVTHFMLDLTRMATRMGASGFGKIWDASEDEVREGVNTLNVELCKKILQRNKKVLEGLVNKCYYQRAPFIVENIVMPGVKERVELDLEKNWHLSDGLWSTHSGGPSCQFGTWLAKQK